MPVRDPKGLAIAMESALSLDKLSIREIGKRSRMSIEKNYSLRKVVDEWEKIYSRLNG